MHGIFLRVLHGEERKVWGRRGIPTSKRRDPAGGSPCSDMTGSDTMCFSDTEAADVHTECIMHCCVRCMLQSDGVSWDCPHSGHQTAYEPHYIDPFAREKGVKIRQRDRRLTTQNNMEFERGRRERATR